MAKTMAKLQSRASKKTMAKLQPRTSKKSSKKSAAPPRTKPKAKARPKQRFNVNHFRAEDFRTDGLRSYAQYRDLGMSKATSSGSFRPAIRPWCRSGTTTTWTFR